MFDERKPTGEFTGTGRSLGMTAVENLIALTDMAFYSTHRSIGKDLRGSSWLYPLVRRGVVFGVGEKLVGLIIIPPFAAEIGCPRGQWHEELLYHHPIPHFPTHICPVWPLLSSSLVAKLCPLESFNGPQSLPRQMKIERFILAQWIYKVILQLPIDTFLIQF